MRIDLNCDMGESFGTYEIGADEALMPLITSANIACGFHAGDPLVADRTVALAARSGVAMGAHPGYQDLRGFGRRPIQASPEEVEADVLYQVGALAGFVRTRLLASTCWRCSWSRSHWRSSTRKWRCGSGWRPSCHILWSAYSLAWPARAEPLRVRRKTWF